MATRRIPRGRGGSPIPIIVLSVILVGLLASTIVLGLNVGELEKQVTRAEEKLKAEEARRKKMESSHIAFEQCVGFTLEGAKRELDTLKEQLQAKAPLPAVADVEGPPKTFSDLKTLVQGYADRCAGLEKVLASLERELAQAKEARDAAEREVKEKVAAKDKQLAVEKKAVEDAQKDKARVEAERDEVRTKLTAEVEDLKSRNAKLAKDLAKVQKDNEVLQRTIAQLEEDKKALVFGKKELRPTPGTGPEPADGKVLQVDPDGKHVMVNIGRKDWPLEPGMIFTVFERGEMDTRKEKGQVQIRFLYDDIARAKVIKQDDLDPILPGMLLVNPAFKRGAKPQFRLVGRFAEPRIEQFLSRYPCTIVEKVSMDTDYVVIGDAKPDEAKGEAPWEEHEDVLFARENKITIMRERELLHYLGER